jgi:putative FmdB family regulatory protein
MPIYEYGCSVCGVVEVIQRFSDAPLEQCPQCAETGTVTPVSRLLSVSAFHLKGGGWYKTDYASGGSAGVKKGAGGAGSSGGSESSGGDTPSVTAAPGGAENSSGGSSSSGTSGGGCGSSCGCH